MQVRCTAEKLIIRALPSGLDTNFRLLRDEVVTTVGQSFDGAWLYVYNNAVAGWANRTYLEDVVSAPVAPAAPDNKLLYSLEGEDPELTEKIEKLRVEALHEGIEFKTADFGGMRTQADTVKIMKYRDDDYAVYLSSLKRNRPNATPIAKEVWRRIAPFGSSYHNYGAARDLKPTKWPASFTESAALDRLRALAPTVDLALISNDPPHFQLPITLTQARARWQSRQPQ